MKLPKPEPSWGIAIGFVLAPLASMLNVVILNFVAGSGGKLESGVLNLGFLSMVLTGPLGFLTTRLLEIWNKGDHGKARSMGLVCGLFSLCFWFWVYRTLQLSQRWSQYRAPALLGTLLLPFLWSLLLPIFALLARPPKN